MIVSVHLPKTAGTSFAATLERHFGSGFLRDYEDLPINTPNEDRHRAALQNARRNAERDFRGIHCIHGHFLPIKYLPLVHRPEVKFVTWLRHPVDRVLSHYGFWRCTFDPATAPPLHRRMMEEAWSLERFCLGPEMQDLYGQFLWDFPMENFAFVGIAEFYAEDLEFFTPRFLGASCKAEHLNARSKPTHGEQIPAALREEIKRHHAGDMELYQQALGWREKRRAA